jgi:hypothetical protein
MSGAARPGTHRSEAPAGSGTTAGLRLLVRSHAELFIPTSCSRPIRRPISRPARRGDRLTDSAVRGAGKRVRFNRSSGIHRDADRRGRSAGRRGENSGVEERHQLRLWNQRVHRKRSDDERGRKRQELLWRGDRQTGADHAAVRQDQEDLYDTDDGFAHGVSIRREQEEWEAGRYEFRSRRDGALAAARWRDRSPRNRREHPLQGRSIATGTAPRVVCCP